MKDFLFVGLPRTVGSGPEVENEIIFASSVHPRTVEQASNKSKDAVWCHSTPALLMNKH